MCFNQCKKQPCGNWEVQSGNGSRVQVQTGNGRGAFPQEGQKVEVGVCSGKWKISLVVEALSAFAHRWVGAAPPGIHCVHFVGFFLYFPVLLSFCYAVSGGACVALLNVVISASVPHWRSQQQGKAFMATFWEGSPYLGYVFLGLSP